MPGAPATILSHGNMTFGEALKKGLEAHRRAAEARKEMDEVLAAASKEVAAVTGSPISFRFEVVDRPRSPQIGAPKLDALVARLDTGNLVILGEVDFGDLGYPVTLRWQNRRDSAQDRAAFEELVKTILEHGSTGAKIAELMGRG